MTDWNYGLAANGASAASNGNGGGTAPGQAIDGSDVSYWQSAYYGGAANIVVDLGVPQAIDSIRVLASQDADCFGPWALDYCDDGSSWQSSGVTCDAGGESSHALGGITARYWKLSKWATAAAHRIHSIDLIGAIVAPPPPGNPEPGFIDAWLDGLEANYVPTVQDWLDAH